MQCNYAKFSPVHDSLNIVKLLSLSMPLLRLWLRNAFRYNFFLLSMTVFLVPIYSVNLQNSQSLIFIKLSDLDHNNWKFTELS